MSPPPTSDLPAAASDEPTNPSSSSTSSTFSASSIYEVTSYGAGFTALYAPPKANDSAPTNILLALPTAAHYRTHPHPYFHGTIGRVANRIADAELRDLNGRDYRFAANNGPHCNHGGARGWDKRDWVDGGLVRRGFAHSVGDEGVEWEGAAEEPSSSSSGSGPASGSRSRGSKRTRSARLFTLLSGDGDEGFPGAVQARVWYACGRGRAGENVVEVEYEAELADGGEGDEEGLETPVAMTNHAYFNLDPTARSIDRTLAGHTAKLATSRHLPWLTDSPGIPEGRFEDYPGVPRVPFASFGLADEETGQVLEVDDCFVLDDEPAAIPTDTRGWPLQTLAELHCRRSGIQLAVESTEPAFQFYTGRWIDVPGWEAGEDEDGRKWEAQDGYGPFAGVCIEPSRYVNAAGKKKWRNQVMLKKGKLYGALTRYVISRK